jgi:hypothetical protein
MAKSSRSRAKKTVRPAKRRAVKRRPKAAARKRPIAATTRRSPDALVAPMKGTERREIGHVTLDVARTGGARVKRMIYPPGFHWAKDMKPSVGTDFCMHAHVGFLARGEIHIEYADGCIVECKAPQVIAIEPGHDGWVVGKEHVVLIEVDFENDTVGRLGMPDGHRH